MCTNEILREHIRNYAVLKAAAADLEKQIEEEKKFIIAEMDARAAADTASENEKNFIFMDKKIITERMQESATKAGKELIKKNVTNDIDKYLTVSLARYINPSVTRYF